MTGSEGRKLSSISLWEFLGRLVLVILMFLVFSLIIITYICGFFYSLYHVFTRKSMSDDKFFMITFAILTNSISGFAAAYSMHLEKLWPGKWYLGIFPLWVWFNSIFLLCRLFQSTESPADTEEFEEILADNDATPAQVIIALIVLLAVFGLCLFVFKLNWAFTLTISVAYATGFSKAFRELIPNKTQVADKTSEQ
jgi:4-hydroxybenzoate polyprenyltransferase